MVYHGIRKRGAGNIKHHEFCITLRFWTLKIHSLTKMFGINISFQNDVTDFQICREKSFFSEDQLFFFIDRSLMAIYLSISPLTGPMVV